MTASNPADRLDSWKEIAAYLRRDVRTVQRWEKKEGLPVYRHLHDKLGSIYAYRNELTEWFKARQQSGAGTAQPNGETTKVKLAVLPFGNLSDAKEDGYFSDGLTEEMITQITRLQAPELAVIARTTAEHYDPSSKSLEQMKKDLGVGYVLEGKVRRGGNRVRITAQLIQLRDQTQLWAETFERDLSDVLSVQADIAQAIAREINQALNLTERVQVSSMQKGQGQVQPAAYDAYLKARYHLHQMTPSAISKSIECFEKAIQAEPHYAPAYAGLASAYALLAIAPFDFLPPHDAMPKAEKAARKSLELDGSFAEAHTALALVNHHYHWKWQEAEAGYEQAIELNPDHADTHLWYSWLLLALGRNNDAFDEIEQSLSIVQETNPHRMVAVHTTRAAAYYFGRDYQRAVEECEKAEQLDPKYFMLHFIAGRAHMRLNNYAKAIGHLKLARTGTGEMPLMDAALGLAYAVSGKKGLTAKLAEQFKAAAKRRYIPPTYFGMLFAGLGDKDKALEWLETAFAERADGLTWLNVEPMLDELRSDAKFQDLVRRIGLPSSRGANS
ncbi:MAG TPA: tetratricopeptide repeat protein [Candidatus Angelobacter sp.]|nr:tetratricopeptide repeat protein [Candidatus Angelobacter sp.]